MYYTVDNIGEGVGKSWKGGVGYITREMATTHMPPPSDDNLVLVCGPPPMYKALSGEKKNPKDQGNRRQLQQYNMQLTFCARTKMCVILVAKCGLVMCRGAVRDPESNGLHRTAGFQVLIVTYYFIYHAHRKSCHTVPAHTAADVKPH